MYRNGGIPHSLSGNYGKPKNTANVVPMEQPEKKTKKK
jgi:hypothetical protein